MNSPDEAVLLVPFRTQSNEEDSCCNPVASLAPDVPFHAIEFETARWSPEHGPHSDWFGVGVNQRRRVS
jgi:hypothetical protein